MSNEKDIHEEQKTEVSTGVKSSERQLWFAALHRDMYVIDKRMAYNEAVRKGREEVRKETISKMRENGFTEEQIRELLDETDIPKEPKVGDALLDTETDKELRARVRMRKKASMDERSALSYAWKEGFKESYIKCLKKNFEETFNKSPDEITGDDREALETFFDKEAEKVAREKQRLDTIAELREKGIPEVFIKDYID